MKTPKRLDFTPEQIEELIDRLNKESLKKEDYPILADLLKAMANDNRTEAASPPSKLQKNYKAG